MFRRGIGVDTDELSIGTGCNREFRGRQRNILQNVRDETHARSHGVALRGEAPRYAQLRGPGANVSGGGAAVHAPTRTHRIQI